MDKTNKQIESTHGITMHVVSETWNDDWQVKGGIVDHHEEIEAMTSNL